MNRKVKTWLDPAQNDTVSANLQVIDKFNRADTTIPQDLLPNQLPPGETLTHTSGIGYAFM